MAVKALLVKAVVDAMIKAATVNFILAKTQLMCGQA